MLILACATERECHSALSRLAPKPPSANMRLQVAGRDLLACVVGIGPVAAALSMGALLERFPETTGILNLGICGSFDPLRNPLGTPCVASAEIWPEYGVHHVEQKEEVFAHQMFPDLSLSPVNRVELDPVAAASVMQLVLPAAWPCGPSLTVAGVSGDSRRAEMLQTRHNAATENMEGFSLALAAHRWGIPFLEIRTVSNPVGERDKRLWNFRQALAALQNILPILTGAAV
jgi:futalosine hydrolase